MQPSNERLQNRYVARQKYFKIYFEIFLYFFDVPVKIAIFEITKYIGAHWVNKIAPKAHEEIQMALKHRIFSYYLNNLKAYPETKMLLRLWRFALIFILKESILKLRA